MSQIINILCARLPGEVTRPMYREYDRYHDEIEKILGQQGSNCSVLRSHEQVVFSLLGLSLYYRYVIGSMKGAMEMYDTLNKGNERECPIKIGDYVLNHEQRNKMLGVIVSLKKLMKEYQIDSDFFEFTEPLEFVRNCKDLFYKDKYAVDYPF